MLFATSLGRKGLMLKQEIDYPTWVEQAHGRETWLMNGGNPDFFRIKKIFSV